MIDDTVQGAHVLGAHHARACATCTARRRSRKVEDIKGLKVRVQATATEDAMFPAYGAQTVHMPFGNVYTSLQTGVVDVAENGVNVYLVNKHYEVAPVLSMTEHEANNNFIWVSDKTVEEPHRPSRRNGCRRRPTRSARTQPAKAIALEHESADEAQDDRRQDRRPTSTSPASSRPPRRCRTSSPRSSGRMRPRSRT